MKDLDELARILRERQGTQESRTQDDRDAPHRRAGSTDPDASEEGLFVRCRERCLYLLTDTERSEQNLRDKLRKSGKYPDPVIDRTMEFLRTYGYLDDHRLAEHILEFYRGSKSIREIEKKMYERGIPAEEIREVISAYRESGAQDEELETVRALIRKKTSDVSLLDPAARKKLCAYLMRKGFPYGTVARAMQVDEE